MTRTIPMALACTAFACTGHLDSGSSGSYDGGGDTSATTSSVGSASQSGAAGVGGGTAGVAQTSGSGGDPFGGPGAGGSSGSVGASGGGGNASTTTSNGAGSGGRDAATTGTGNPSGSGSSGAGAGPGAFWLEDFETVDFSDLSSFGEWEVWGWGPGTMEEVNGPQTGKIDTVFDDCHSGSKCLRLHFTSLDAGAGPHATRLHPDSTHVFLRYWIRMPTDFVNSGISTKLVYAPRGTGQPSCLTLTQGSGRLWFNCQTYESESGGWSAGTADPGLSTYPTGPDIQDGQWHCVENEMYMGTPGNSDGHMRYWLDDELVAELFDKPFIDAPEQFNIVRLYRERGLGDLYFDDIVIGTERHYCN